MPIYEYACHDCGREFETLVRSDTVPACPRCHSTQLDAAQQTVQRIGHLGPIEAIAAGQHPHQFHQGHQRHEARFFAAQGFNQARGSG